LKAWKDLYSATIGLRFGRELVKEKKKRLTTIAFFDEDIDGMTSLFDHKYEMYVDFHKPKNPEPVQRYARIGYPIKYIEQNVTFPSLRKASESLMIPIEYIKYCCEGDIPVVHMGMRTYHFEYGNPLDIPKSLLRESRKTQGILEGVPIYCITNQKDYPSIVKAARDTGVAIRNIKRCCEGFVLKKIPKTRQEKYGVSQWDFGKMGAISTHTGELYRFEYADKYAW